MKVIGLTGPTGAGKSLFCEVFLSLGIPCLDTDLVARKVVEKGTACLSELVMSFGEKILLPDGSLDRKALGSIAFSDKEKLDTLNKITHKYITEYVKSWLAECESKGSRAAVIDAPQLFESGENKICDITVAVIAKKELRLERIMQRDSIALDYAEKRMASQKDDEFFIDNCDYIIYNNGVSVLMKKDVIALAEKLGLVS